MLIPQKIPTKKNLFYTYIFLVAFLLAALNGEAFCSKQTEELDEKNKKLSLADFKNDTWLNQDMGKKIFYTAIINYDASKSNSKKVLDPVSSNTNIPSCELIPFFTHAFNAKDWIDSKGLREGVTLEYNQSATENGGDLTSLTKKICYLLKGKIENVDKKCSVFLTLTFPETEEQKKTRSILTNLSDAKWIQGKEAITLFNNILSGQGKTIGTTKQFCFTEGNLCYELLQPRLESNLSPYKSENWIDLTTHQFHKKVSLTPQITTRKSKEAPKSLETFVYTALQTEGEKIKQCTFNLIVTINSLGKHRKSISRDGDEAIIEISNPKRTHTLLDLKSESNRLSTSKWHENGGRDLIEKTLSAGTPSVDKDLRIVFKIDIKGVTYDLVTSNSVYKKDDWIDPKKNTFKEGVTLEHGDCPGDDWGTHVYRLKQPDDKQPSKYKICTFTLKPAKEGIKKEEGKKKEEEKKKEEGKKK